MADQNITALPVATSPTSSDQLLLVGATEEKLIDYDKLADAILTKLTSKQYTLDQGTKTLPAALNELNSNRLTAYARGTYNEIKINANGYASLAKNDIDLSECKFATMVNYTNINPKTAITIYASSQRAYIIGEPNAIIYGLEVDFWK
mgnify:CR=1 FL=1